MTPEVRFATDEDYRRELAVKMMKRHLRAAGITTDYDADIEYMEHALVAFADEWATRCSCVCHSGVDGQWQTHSCNHCNPGRR